MNKNHSDMPKEVFVAFGEKGPTLEGVYWSEANAQDLLGQSRFMADGGIELVRYVRADLSGESA